MNLMYMYMAIQIYGLYEPDVYMYWAIHMYGLNEPDVYVLDYTDIRSL